MVSHSVAVNDRHAFFELKTALVSNHPFVNVQDSKHGAKTSRNQLFSGARLLSLGQHVLLYSQLVEIAHEPGGPLMISDVEHLDRQDDRAAARLLSSAVLKHIAERHQDWVGLGVYLFIVGGIFEAWQNRMIGHDNRLRLVLRARYFLHYWREHIVRHPLHTLAINFISRESFDILTIICESYIKLLRIYRDIYPGQPFIPWLHSTESNEHLFGVARTVKTDFTYLDFLQLVPKIGSLLLGAFGESMAYAKGSATRSGYYHTWFNIKKLNLIALRIIPGDGFIDMAASASYLEAAQLLEACGVYPVEVTVN